MTLAAIVLCLAMTGTLLAIALVLHRRHQMLQKELATIEQELKHLTTSLREIAAAIYELKDSL